MTRKLFSISLLLICFTHFTGFAQNTIYVDSSNVNGLHNGNSWTTAYNNFQIAINNASAGDSIFVAKGTYQLAYNVSFLMKDSVKIYGGFSAVNTTFSTRDWDLNKTILRGNNSMVLDNRNNDLTPATVLNGFTITNGKASSGGGMHNDDSSPTLENLIFIDNTAIGNGGGMYNDNSSPLMNNISFIDNYANSGGGMLNYNSSNPIVTNSAFILNNSSRGGGMYNADSSPTVTNVVFDENSGYDFGGGMYNNNNSSPLLNDVLFIGNTSNSTGGGMHNSTSLPILNNVIFYNNSATYWGGGIHNTSYAHITMNNVTFINNYAQRGGGVFNYQSSPSLNNVTFTGNTAQYSAGAMANYNYSNSYVKNSIFWGNSVVNVGEEISNFQNSGSNLNYCYTPSFYPGTGNILGTISPFINISNPMGADGIWMTADDGLALACNSPVTNVGKNSYVNSGVTTDITGAARISGGIVDMGAYENPFNVEITGNTLFCVGASISDTLVADVNGGVGPYTYSWSTTSTNDSIVINALGTFYVTVTDSDGCVVSDTVSATEYSPNVDIIGDTAFCTGTNIMDTLLVNVSGGKTPYTYLWNTSSTNDSILLNSTGSYSVTVTDANGCSNADTVQVTDYLPIVNIIGNADFCDGTTETLLVNVSGQVGPSTYLWNTSETTTTINLNTGGTYSVTATDVNGCSNSDTLQVAVNALPIVSIDGNLSICLNESELLTANVTGAANPHNFLWNNSSTSSSISVNTAGSYHVTVTDANGCLGADTVQVGTNPLPNLNIMGDSLFCTGLTDTLFSIATGTVGPYSYLWNTSSTNDTILFNSAGTYSVEVTDANGCSNTDSIQVNDYLPQVTITGNTSFCAGTSDTLVANVSGAIGTYTYLWNTSDINDSIIINTGGTYNVMVLDANGCANEDSIQVTQNQLPNVSITGNSYPRRNDYDTLTATGAEVYLWSTGSIADTTIILATADTIYYVTGTDINGCVNSDTFAITINTVGTKDYSKENEFVLFPNPANHTVYLKLTGAMYSGEADLKIIDQRGKTVVNQEALINNDMTLPINVSRLAKGVYFIEVSTSAFSSKLKFVKN